jgi:hypothetical protein
MWSPRPQEEREERETRDERREERETRDERREERRGG